VSLYLPIAQISMDAFLLVGIGLAVGILSGLFGIGGGFIMTPLLIFLGVPPFVAVGTGASQVVASSVSGALGHWRRNNVDVKLGLVLLAGGLIGSTFGVRLQQFLKALGQLEFFTAAIYVVMLSVVGGLMLTESIRTLWPLKTAVVRTKAGRHSWLDGLPFKQRFRTAKLYASAIPPALIGALVGVLTAIMGVGGGFLLIPALIYLLHVSTRVALGTSGFQIVFLTAYTTVLQATQNHSVDLLLALPLMLGGVTGAQIGVRMSEKLNAAQLRLLLALLVLLVAVRMAVDLTLRPDELFNLETIIP
jgi:uncharacterized protein